ncbi:hypothetical protein Mal4_20790 [Maioricimonas rarisocia]|uniref:VWFA domain-containing protein n=2 Tax=Maioricimonas rarisocia TaxID=2528026 RepID=A0A517Z5J3_9PLAN|nr:hypothetical protein Mal4_20790 [Maioricimonas rarisocia]
MFHGLELTSSLLLLLGGVAIAIVCIVLLYRYERRLVTRRLGVTLLSLRIAAIVTLLLMLLEPVIGWTLNREQTGRVIVAVDVSESMETADEHADEAEKLRWARALGLIGNERNAEQIDAWIAAYEADREPEWVAEDETDDPDRRQALADGRREFAENAMQQAMSLTRLDIARRLLTDGSEPLIDQLDQLAITEAHAFGGQTIALDPRELEQNLDEISASVQPGVTNLTEGLFAGAGATDGPPLAGVIVWTDGRDTGPIATRQLIARAASRGVPIYPVLLGSSRRPRDLAIGVVDAPSTVYVEDEPVVKADVMSYGYEGRQLSVHLEKVGDEEQSRQTQQFVADRPSRRIEFALPAEDVGRHKYRIWIDSDPEETRDDNNEKSFTITVVDDTSRVLLVEGEGRWEFRYLLNALNRDDRVQVDPILFDQPYMGVLPDTFFPRTLNLQDDRADAVGDTSFADYDIVLLGDVAPFHVGPAVWEQLDRYVREEGGTLVLTAGKNYFPRAHDSLILRDLLPVRNPRPFQVAGEVAARSPASRGFALQLTPEGIDETIFQLNADPAANSRIWAALPGHPWGMVGEARGGTTVWATAVDPENRPRGLRAERENALIVHQYLGAGQVLWIGIDSTWRWRLRTGDLYHHRFWGQLVRWAAEFKAAVGNEFVRFGPDRSMISEGEEVLLRARWKPNFLRRFPDVTATANIFPAGQRDEAPMMSIELKPDLDSSLLHKATARGLPAGNYEIELQIEGAEAVDRPIVAELIVSPQLTNELADLAADRELLQRLARETGGRMFLPDEVGEIPDLFRDVTESSSEYREQPLWNQWPAFAVLCTILMAEWVLRKLNGLP